MLFLVSSVHGVLGYLSRRSPEGNYIFRLMLISKSCFRLFSVGPRESIDKQSFCCLLYLDDKNEKTVYKASSTMFVIAVYRSLPYGEAREQVFLKFHAAI